MEMLNKVSINFNSNMTLCVLVAFPVFSTSAVECNLETMDVKSKCVCLETIYVKSCDCLVRVYVWWQDRRGTLLYVMYMSLYQSAPL